MGSTFSSIGTAVAGEMQKKQLETMELQRENQRKMMELQMKRQISMQMAATREMLYWQFGTYCLFLLAATAGTIKMKKLHPAVVVPGVVGPIIMGYQVDLAWGNKSDRIKIEAEKGLRNSVTSACLGVSTTVTSQHGHHRGGSIRLNSPWRRSSKAALASACDREPTRFL